VIIEKKIDSVVIQDNSNIYIKQINMYEDDIQELKKIINQLNIKINVNNQKDTEINKLIFNLSDIKKEYLILYNLYESLLTDFKIIINANEKLRQLVFDLENKIESHNKNILGIDISIKQHIEQLTRNSLANKNIIYESNKNYISKMKSDNELMFNKIELYDKHNLSFIEYLPKIKIDINNFSINNSNCNNYYSTHMNNDMNNDMNNNNNLIEITGIRINEINFIDNNYVRANDNIEDLKIKNENY
jgi:hypothetical protein